MSALAVAAFHVASASSVLAQGQPAPGLAPLQPKVPMQQQLPIDRKPITIDGNKLTSPITPRIPTTPVLRKPDIALQSITYAEATVMANDQVKISFRANTKNIGNTDVLGAYVRCGVSASAADLGPSQVGSPWKSEQMVAYGGVSKPGDTHVVPIVLMMPFSANRELMRKWLKINCKLDFNPASDDSVAANNRLESSVQFPDDTVLYYPIY
ncbi:MAG: hypothetical protein ACRDAM_02130 [Casimicrobium sp.]